MERIGGWKQYFKWLKVSLDHSVKGHPRDRVIGKVLLSGKRSNILGYCRDCGTDLIIVEDEAE